MPPAPALPNHRGGGNGVTAVTLAANRPRCYRRVPPPERRAELRRRAADAVANEYSN